MQKLNHSHDIIVSAIKIEDAAIFHELLRANYRHLLPYFPITLATVTSLDSAADFIRRKMEKVLRREGYYFLISCDNNIAGVLSVKHVNWRQSKAEIAYFISTKYEGRGICTAGIAWLKEFCFEELNLQKVFAKINAANFASKKILEKNGFHFESLLINDYHNLNGELTNSHCYAKCRD